MEGQGTDLDTWRDLRAQMARNDDDIRALKDSMTELDRGYTRVEAKLEAQGESIDQIAQSISQLASADVEEAKRRQSIAWPLATGMLALVSVLVAISTFIFGPYTDQVRANSVTLTAIQQTRYTADDAVRDLRRLEEEIDAEVEEKQAEIDRLADRVQWLERNR